MSRHLSRTREEGERICRGHVLAALTPLRLIMETHPSDVTPFLGRTHQIIYSLGFLLKISTLVITSNIYFLGVWRGRFFFSSYVLSMGMSKYRNHRLFSFLSFLFSSLSDRAG